MGWWQEYAQDDLIRQGDVIRRYGTAGKLQWGLVVTADCDIAQNKAGDRVTWLSIVPAADFLRNRWAPDQLLRLRQRQSQTATDALNAQIRKRDESLATLTAASLERWLATHEPAAIWDALVPAVPIPPKLLATLTVIGLAAGQPGPTDPLERLRAAWTALGRDAAQQRAALTDALASGGGFPDFFLLPDLPAADQYGHVVLLRDIAALRASELYPSEQDVRIAGMPHAWHRVARLDDGIRFAITQKLAFLFSRIGLPTAFEHACSAATSLVVEAIGLEDHQ